MFQRQRIAILGGSGSGKTVTTAVLIEEMDRVGFDFFIIDTEGEFISLKDFNKDRFSVYGNIYSETSLGVSNYRLRSAVDAFLFQRKSIILNLRQYKRADQNRIIIFCLEMIRQKIDFGGVPKHNRVIVFDEAHELAPQSARSGDMDLLELIIFIAKKGRKRDVGCIVATQRPSSLSKDVYSQCEIQFLHRVYIPIDKRKYYEVLDISTRYNEEFIDEALLNMQRGDCFFMMPPSAGLASYEYVNIRNRLSSHPSDIDKAELVR